MSVSAYRAATRLGAPLIRRYLDRRRAAGREDAARFPERMGIPSQARTDGPLVWLHAASLGESLSLLSVIERLRRERPEIALLMTSGTVSSANVLADRLPADVVHQYAPVDRVPWVRRFLDHWRPDMALWVESEFWPAILSEIRSRRIPTVLMNARLSDRSWRLWRRAPWMIRPLLRTFELCMAQSELDADRLRGLGAQRVSCPGNLKFAAPPLPAREEALRELSAAVSTRPRWLAFSTHPGEEEILARAHRLLAQRAPGVLTMIAPRHPARGPAIENALRAAGLNAAVRSRREIVEVSTDVFLADTIGELGLFFRTTDIALVGGSLVPHGGQNPIEPALLDCALLHGPHMENFLAIEGELRAAGAAVAVSTPQEIAREVGLLTSNPGYRRRRMVAAKQVAAGKQAILDAVFSHLDGILNRVSPARPVPLSRNAGA